MEKKQMITVHRIPVFVVSLFDQKIWAIVDTIFFKIWMQPTSGRARSYDITVHN